MPVYLLGEEPVFPPVHLAEKDGMLAVGGDLSAVRLLEAYKHGIFPWFNEGYPHILWWSPDPRFVLFPEKIHVSKSMKKILSSGRFKVTFNRDFAAVIRSCREKRSATGTWITPEMMDSYIDLHRRGFAQSVEVWENDRLAGGLYGVSIGRCFFGESMVSFVPDSSKTALITLAQKLQSLNYRLIDCQMETPHLATLGAERIPRSRFIEIIREGIQEEGLILS
jgi:leucyl/phenylalanyl-tRNA--protein transferase